MGEEIVVEKDLELIGENLSVFTGKDRETEKILKGMGLSFDDIPEEARQKVEEIKEALAGKRKLKKGAVKKDEAIKDRILYAQELLDELEEMPNLPVSIKKLFVEEAQRRLLSVRERVDWVVSQRVAIESTKPLSYNLDLFVKDDDKQIQRKLKMLGITQVPDFVKDAAKRAKEVLEDKTLTAKERALKAADILMEPLQPAIYGNMEGVKLQHEIKCVLWEIANDFVVQAQTSK